MKIYNKIFFKLYLNNDRVIRKYKMTITGFETYNVIVFLKKNFVCFKAA
jgi:hypothetical protein